MFGANTIFSGQTTSRAPLASHPAFAWIMIVWCALLFGLATLVIAAAFSSSTFLPIALGFLAAILGVFCGWQFCSNVGANMPQIGGMPGLDRFRFGRSDNVVAAEAEASASIMSTQDLGSASLDAPLEETSEGFDNAPLDLSSDESIVWDDHDSDQPTAYFEDPFVNDGIDGSASPNDRHAGPALGRPQFSPDALSFGALEDRPDDANLATEGFEPSEEIAPDGPEGDALALDSFELDEQTPAEISEEPADLSLSTEIREEAEVIALKDRDLNDLSLVQMVERFAVGLEGHRVARTNDPASRAMRPSDPRIAQAIRALPIGDLSEPNSDPATRTQAEETEAALREALEKLQRMSDHN